MKNHNQEYDEKMKNIKGYLEQIETLLAKHAEQQRKSTSWGYVGDLGHVENELFEIVDFLR